MVHDTCGPDLEQSAGPGGAAGPVVGVCEGVLEGDFAAGGIRDADARDKRRADASSDGVDHPGFTFFDLELVGVDVIDAIDHARNCGAGFECAWRFAGVVRFRFGELRVGLDDDHDGV